MVVPSAKMRGNEHTQVRAHIFALVLTEHSNKLPREAVGCLNLQTVTDKLGNLVQLNTHEGVN